MSRKDFRPRSS